MELLKDAFCFVFLMSVVILTHEADHFLMARFFGIKVLRFSLGFGPALLKRQFGEVEYAVSLIPLGGYVHMLGEGSNCKVSDQDSSRSFSSQARWKRALVIGAGPLANIILAALILFAMYLVGIRVMGSTVGSVEPGSPAEVAGMAQGDMIMKVDGLAVRTWVETITRIEQSRASGLSIAALRKGELRTFRVEPRLYDSVDAYGRQDKVRGIGIAPAGSMVVKRYTPAEAFVKSIRKTWDFISYLMTFIGKIFAGQTSVRTIGGPVSIARASSAFVEMGAQYYFLLMALFSVNLAVVNLIPIPVLDGGQLMILGIEGLMDRPLSDSVLLRLNIVGVIIIITLIGIALYNDIAGLL